MSVEPSNSQSRKSSPDEMGRDMTQESGILEKKRG